MTTQTYRYPIERSGRKAQHGGYYAGYNQRPTRVAAGAQATLTRSAHNVDRFSKEALRIAVKGTTDDLAFGLSFWTTRVACECCGAATTKLALNNSGRSRLKALRRRRAARAKVAA